MYKRKSFRHAASAIALGLALASPVMAGDRDYEGAASDAWKEGKLDTMYLVNRHLNNFSIDPEVSGDRVILIGKVESEIDRDLAQEIAQGMSGIDEVDNRLQIVPAAEARSAANKDDREYSTLVEDATLAAEVKLKLLANGNTDGLSIDVDAEDAQITLTGTVQSAEEKSLAGKIAGNVEGVRDVDNRLQLEKA